MVLREQMRDLSETLVHIWTTQLFIPEDGNIHNYQCENIKSFILYGVIIAAVLN
jgi:hypothetical protein